VLQCVAVRCSVLQCVAASWHYKGSSSNCGDRHRSGDLVFRVFFVLALFLFCVVYCSVLQCVAVCCNVLQCVAVCCSKMALFWSAVKLRLMLGTCRILSMRDDLQLCASVYAN